MNGQELIAVSSEEVFMNQGNDIGLRLEKVNDEDKTAVKQSISVNNTSTLKEQMKLDEASKPSKI